MGRKWRRNVQNFVVFKLFAVVASDNIYVCVKILFYFFSLMEENIVLSLKLFLESKRSIASIILRATLP